MDELIGALEQYRPWNEQETQDRRLLLELVRRGGSAVYTRRSAAAHLTASAWVVSPDRRQVLLAYHRQYQSWAWLGGHADGERDLLGTALREVREESGVEARPLLPGIFSLEVLSVEGHEKRGSYVSSHLHLNLTYLLEADPADPIRCKPDENSQVAWFPLEEAVSASSEPWFRTRIYPKLNAKLAALFGCAPR